MTDPQATAQPEYISHSWHCGMCGKQLASTNEVCCLIALPPHLSHVARAREEGRQSAFREAAEIARATGNRKLESKALAESKGRMRVASHRQSDFETAEEIAAAIEAKAGSK